MFIVSIFRKFGRYIFPEIFAGRLLFMFILPEVKKPDTEIVEDLRCIIDGKTKPLGALGVLEELALQMGLVCGSFQPEIRHPKIFVFAADHGISRQGVSAYPPEVTAQMVLNFARGGAAINVFCAEHNIDLEVVDAGVNYDFAPDLPITHAKISRGTADCTREDAMSIVDCERAFGEGRRIVSDWYESFAENDKPTVAGFGEMGIGNTSSASLLMHLGTGIDLAECIGRGTGLDDEGLKRKMAVLESVLQRGGRNMESGCPFHEMCAVGGLEIAMMCGAMLQSAALKLLIMVDGFIASSAFLTTWRLCPAVIHYAVFCHQSSESGHGLLLKHVGGRPLLNLDLRLGEGSGCALALPLLRSAAAFINRMASFEGAGVSGKLE
jgi:nicotinate-nucleotide--dimethylbenzimidazole phosphoribosyltransferase